MGNVRSIAGDLVEWDEWTQKQIEERGYNSEFVTQESFLSISKQNSLSFLSKANYFEFNYRTRIEN